MNESDISLLKEVARGDADAFILLMDRYVDMVSRTSFRILCDRVDSEAVTERVFVDLWKDVLDYDDRYTLKEWLIRKTCMYSRLRIVRRRILRIFGVTIDVFVQASPKVEDLDDFVTKRAWELFCRASMNMTPMQSISFTLCALEDLPPVNVAFILGLSNFRVNISYKRAAGKIMNELQHYNRSDDYQKYIGFLKRVSESLTDYDKLRRNILAETGI